MQDAPSKPAISFRARIPGRFSRGLWIVLAAYFVIYAALLWHTDGYPYVLDNNESYSSWWHARSLYENGVAKTKGLTDEVFSPQSAASPYIHSHQGNFPRLFTFVLYALGLRTVGPQIWVTTFTVGLAALWFAFQFFSRLFNPVYAAFTCLALMTDYLFFTQWQVGLYNIWHGFFFFSSLLCVQTLGTTERRGRWFALALLNFAALFYWEYVFTAFVAALCGSYAVVLYWRRFRLVWMIAAAGFSGAALAASLLLTQLMAYMGWANVMEDVRLTLTARNAAADPVLLERVTSFYREHRIIFWHNFMDAAPLRTFTALWSSLLEFHLKYYSPALLYAAAVLAAGWGLGGWRALHGGWRRLIPLLLFACFAGVAHYWSNEAFDESLRNEFLLTPGGPTILALENPLLILLTGLALACAVLGNAAMLGPQAGGSAGLPAFLLCGLLAYGAVYRIFTGYIYSGYLHRFVPLPVFLAAPLLGLMLYTVSQAAWHGLRHDSGTRALRVVTAVVGATALVGCVGYWTMLQATYARVVPADSYAFLARLEQPPLKGRSVVANVYPAPMAARTNSWGYADTSLFSGTLRLTPRGFEVERDLKYLWFADRDTNPDYLKPALAVTVIPTPNFSEALERQIEWRTAGASPRAESSGLFRRARDRFQSFLQHRVVSSDGKRYSLVLLDWDYPPYLLPQDAQIRELAAALNFQQKLTLSAGAQEVARRWRVELDFLDPDPALRAAVSLTGDGRPVVFPAPTAAGPLTVVVNADQLRLRLVRCPRGGRVRIKINDATETIDLGALTDAEATVDWTSARPYGKHTVIPRFAAGFYLQTRLLFSAGAPVAELDYRYAHQEGTPEAATTFRLYREGAAGDWRLVDAVTFLGASGVPIRLAEFRRANPDTVTEHASSAARGDTRTYEQWLAEHLTAHPAEWNRPGIVREALPTIASGPVAGGRVVRRLPLPGNQVGRVQFSVTPGTRTKTGPEYFGLPFSLDTVRPGAPTTVAFTAPAANLDPIALPFGQLRLKLRFPANRWPQSEPILTTGSNEAGDIVYVIYDDAHHIRLGFDHWFKGGPVTKPIPIDFTREHTLDISIGSLFPPAEDVVFVGRSAAQIAAVKDRVIVKLNGQTVIDDEGTCYDSSPSQVMIGKNTIHGTSAGLVFMGKILATERVWQWPESSRGEPDSP